MDIHLQTNPTLHFRVNGGQRSNSRSSAEDEALQFLSQEEQECIQFFEETIDSLEESLDQEERSGPEPVQLHALETSSGTSGPSPGSSSASSPGPSSGTSGPSPGPSAVPPMADGRGSKDQDIIDLLQPDLVQTREAFFDSSMPDFQNMVRTPDSHVDVRSSKRDLMDTLPSEYNPPLPSSGYGPYHPPGSVPTPVLMAQKMAQNLRRGSLDSDKPALSHASPFKQGPPTSTKPSRFPANISVTQSHGNGNNQSLASVSIHERRAQVLANLTGTCHPLEATPPPAPPPPSEKDRNLPTRSVSFRDPTPAQSRMEALSKLGLTRNRARSGGSSLPPTSDTPVTPLPPTDTTDTTDTGTSATPPRQPLVAETRAETAALPDPSPETIEANPSPPSAVTQSTDWPPPPPPPESEPTVAPTPPGVSSLDSNTYGGTSMVVNPSASDNRREPSVSEGWVGHDGKAHPSPVVATMSDYNSYGGKSKVMTPAPAPPLPDILSSHRAPPSPRAAPGCPYEVNSYGGKTRSITPSPRRSNPSSHGPARTPSKAPQAPSPAPKPVHHHHHHHHHGPSLSTPQKAASPEPTRQRSVSKPSPEPTRQRSVSKPSPEPTRQRSVSKPSPEPTRQRSVSKPSPEPTRQRSVSKPSPEPTRRKSVSKPAAFRSQGITVQFSGRGATDESRRDALRKLGLLKDTC